MAVPIVAAEAAEGAAASSAARSASAGAAARNGKKWGPGSRGATAGKPKAADELARRRKRPATGEAPATDAPASGEEAPPTSPTPDGDEGGFLAGFRKGAADGRSLPARGGSTVQTGSGVALAFVAWVWVVLPYLDGGWSRVRDVLRAKLTNVGPNGQDLP